MSSSVPIFVVFAATLAATELLVMWFIAPTSYDLIRQEEDYVMNEIFGEQGELTKQIETDATIRAAKELTLKLCMGAEQWQKPLVHKHPCSQQISPVEQATLTSEPSESMKEYQHFLEIADRAILELTVRSIMRGTVSLANINGTIYREGDTLLLKESEGAFRITAIDVDAVFLSFHIPNESVTTEFGEINRTLQLTRGLSGSFADAGNTE
ncbi:MAG: hypothetical protein QGI78_01565 [Phycisphaerales bacterium]|jgi:hypothetical protein|nr:hypothetical protein [Phycisphaerales bacterium]